MNQDEAIKRYGYGKPVTPSNFPPQDFDFGDVLERSLHGDGDGENNSMFRLYDQGIADWIKKSTFLKGKSLPIVFASPKNAFSEYRDLLGDRFTGNAENLNAFPLPFCSIHFVNHSVRPGYVQHMHIPNIGTATADGKRGVYTRYPVPKWLHYQIEVWSKYRNHHNFLGQLMEEQFWDVLAYMMVKHPHQDGEPMVTAIHKENVQNNSDLPQENKDTIFRWTYSVKVEAWQFFDLMGAPTVDRVVTEVADEETEETLGSATQVIREVEHMIADGVGTPCCEE